MNTILNIIWLFLGGLVLSFGWIVAGILSFIFVITIPFASGCFEMAKSTLTPFGKEIILKKHLGKKPRPISSFLWIILFGIWLALGHIISGISLCFTVVGIPLGMQNFKLVKIAFNPYKYSLIERDYL